MLKKIILVCILISNDRLLFSHSRLMHQIINKLQHNYKDILMFNKTNYVLNCIRKERLKRSLNQERKRWT